MVGSILSTGLQGVQNGVNTTRQAAEDITRATTTAPDESDGLADITEAIVALKVGENQVKASAAVVRTADEVLGTLLDAKA